MSVSMQLDPNATRGTAPVSSQCDTASRSLAYSQRVKAKASTVARLVPPGTAASCSAPMTSLRAESAMSNCRP